MENNISPPRVIQQLYTKDTKVQRIFHLSDLHIRTGSHDQSRFHEYNKVIGRLLTTISKLLSPSNLDDDELCLCVITGDIFHHKLKVEPSGIDLFFKLVEGLSHMLPTIIIRGNHDVKQEDSILQEQRQNKTSDHESLSSPDLVQSLLAGGLYNVHYFNKTGFYIVGDTLFGLVDIVDALEKGASSGTSESLCPFPNPEDLVRCGVNNHDNHHALCDYVPPSKRIALFHGTIAQSTIPNGYTLEWICGPELDRYDAVLLGDVHLQQVHGSGHVSNKSIDYLSLDASNDVFLGSPTQSLTSTSMSTQGTNNGSLIWGYAGSLVQQDFGEPLLGHGFLTWSFDERPEGVSIRVNRFHLRNDYGMVNLNLSIDAVGNEIWHLVNGKDMSYSLGECLSQSWFPCHKIRVKVRTRDNVSDTQFLHCLQRLESMFSHHNIVCDVISCNRTIDTHNDCNNSVSSKMLEGNNEHEDTIVSCNDYQNWIEYIKSTNYSPHDATWTTFFENYESLLLPISEDVCLLLDSNTVDKLQDRNTKIRKKYELYQVNEDASTNPTRPRSKEVTLLYLEWNWILCYGEGNKFDFQKNCDQKVILISANNACGKSSFLETISISLFGDGFPSRSGRETSSSLNMINQHALTMKPIPTAFTKIMLKLDIDECERIFRITREFHVTKDGKMNSKKARIEERENDNTWTKVQSGKVMVDKWVCSHVGTLDKFLASVMLTQSNDQDFFTLKTKSQKEILDDMFNIDNVSNYSDAFKEAYLGHSYFQDLLASLLASTHKDLDKLTKTLDSKDISCLEDLQNCYVSVQTTLVGVNRELDQIEVAIDAINDELLSMTHSVPTQYRWSSQSQDVESIDDVIEYIEGDLSELSIPMSHNHEMCDNVDLQTISRIFEEHGIQTFTEFQDIDKELAIELELTRDKIESLQRHYDNLNSIRSTYGLDAISQSKTEDKSRRIGDSDALSILKSALGDCNSASSTYEEFEAELKQILTKKHELKTMKSSLASLPKDLRTKADDDELQNAVTTLHTDMEDMDASEMDIRDRIDALESIKSQRASALRKEETLLNRLIHKKPNAPTHTMTDIDEYRNTTRLSLHEDSLDDDNHILDICRTYHEHADKIKTLTESFKSHPFNDNCWACRNVPWRLDVYELQTAMTNIEKEIIDRDKVIITLDLINQFDEYYKSRDLNAKMIQWKATYGESDKKVSLWRDEIEDMDATIRSLSRELESNHKKQKQLSNTLLTIREYQSICKHFMVTPTDVENPDFEKELSMKSAQISDIINAMETLKGAIWTSQEGINKTLTQLWSEQTEKMVVHELHRNQYTCILRAVGLQETVEDISEEIVKDITSRIDYAMIWSKHVSLVAAKGYLIRLQEKLQLTNDRKRLAQSRVELVEKMTKLEQVKDKWIHLHKRIELLEKNCDELAVRSKTIYDLQLLMKNFKEWYYLHRMKPMLERETNRILSKMCENDKLLRLRMCVHHRSSSIVGTTTTSDSRKEFDILWTVEDGVEHWSCPIEKVSGYQAFMLGLCFRIALSYVSTSLGHNTNIKWRQLFIDEGFTSCDASNLEKIPYFIKQLLDRYRTIILVSHLEQIKDAVDYNVKIHRQKFLHISNITHT